MSEHRLTMKVIELERKGQRSIGRLITRWKMRGSAEERFENKRDIKVICDRETNVGTQRQIEVLTHI